MADAQFLCERNESRSASEGEKRARVPIKSERQNLSCISRNKKVS